MLTLGIAMGLASSSCGGSSAAPDSSGGLASSAGGSSAGGSSAGGSSEASGGATQGDGGHPDDGSGGNEGQGELFDCDARKIQCATLVPVEPCEAGMVYSVVEACYGTCVPITACTCDEMADCPDPDGTEAYTCIVSRHRCSPWLT